ncbi:interferon-induced protein 44-like [Ostrea edulis]|uniref:interferon-induced protein 44-like n=1 Tax=Ostrea edulis TaxID=37623 RepID=UPI002094816A|nr:interferon-induced protein 44-like [Ostrea edulis]
MDSTQSIPNEEIHDLKEGLGDGLVKAIKQLQEGMNGLQKHQKITNSTLQQFLEQINVITSLPKNRRVIGGVLLVGGGVLLFTAYMIKNRLQNKSLEDKPRSLPMHPSAEPVQILLPEPWRKIHPTETDIPKIKEFYRRKIVDICHDKGMKLNILLLGEGASGKSSFINSCQTALGQSGSISQIATVLDGSSDSVTKHLEVHGMQVKDDGGQEHIPVRLFDCRGLLDEKRGVQTQDIINICDGHVKDKYEIRPDTPINISDPKYREKSRKKDKIHCIVYVMDAQNQNGDNFVGQKVRDQFEEVKRYLSRSGNPQLTLLTKIDRLGIRHMDKIFYDQRVKECCEMASSFLGFSLGCVLPQANYCEEVIPSVEKDLITLFNIWKIMESAKSYVQKTSAMTESVPM